MSGLPAGKKTLPKILADADDAHRVIDLVILLDYLLSTLGDEDGATSTRERVDRNANLFRRKGDVHFGITVRNRLAHTDRDERPPTDEEVKRAREHLVSALKELQPYLSPDLRPAISGGRLRGMSLSTLRGGLPVVCAFFGAWQLYAFLAELLVEQLGGVKGSRWFILLIGLVFLNQVLVPRSARWLPRVTLFLRVVFVSYLLGLGIAIRGVVLWSSGATQQELVDGYCSWFGGLGEGLEAILGQGIWAAAPWLVLGREETWTEVTRLGWLGVVVYLGPILVMVAAYLWAFRPSRWSRKVAQARVVSERWPIWVAYALGVFLVVERIADAVR